MNVANHLFTLAIAATTEAQRRGERIDEISDKHRRECAELGALFGQIRSATAWENWANALAATATATINEDEND